LSTSSRRASVTSQLRWHVVGTPIAPIHDQARILELREPEGGREHGRERGEPSGDEDSLHDGFSWRHVTPDRSRGERLLRDAAGARGAIPRRPCVPSRSCRAELGCGPQDHVAGSPNTPQLADLASADRPSRASRAGEAVRAGPYRRPDPRAWGRARRAPRRPRDEVHGRVELLGERDA